MICPHPNKTSPKRWRVQDKVLREQRYFSFKEYGSKEAALLAAEKFEEGLDKRRKMRALRLSLDSNKLFDEHGLVKGLIVTRWKGGVILKAQMTKDGNQISNSRTLHNRTIRTAFDELCEWLMANKEVDSTKQIKRELASSFRMFESFYKDKLTNVIEKKTINE